MRWKSSRGDFDIFTSAFLASRLCYPSVFHTSALHFRVLPVPIQPESLPERRKECSCSLMCCGRSQIRDKHVSVMILAPVSSGSVTTGGPRWLTRSACRRRHSKFGGRWGWSRGRYVVLIRVDLVGSLGCLGRVGGNILGLVVGWWRRSISTHRISRAMSVRRLLGWIIGQVMGMLRIPLGECHSLLARDQPPVICQWRETLSHASSGVEIA